MPGLLGDVDAHDALEQRVAAAAPQGDALHVVDRVLPAEHEHEEQLGKAAAELHNLSCGKAHRPGHAGDVEARAVDELLEHQGVLRLLDDLVIGVPEGR